ncbi:MAG: hypothetical protein MUC60_10990 [Oscillatoria sp. Prado101]|jgi:hypothetical protein|nr:hypothetical protein [Oscillatoria sp. Prado101]
MPAERKAETNTVRLIEIASQHASARRWAEAEQPKPASPADGRPAG